MERDLVLLFAGLLIGGALALLFLPLLHRLADRGWVLLGMFALPALAAAVVSVGVVLVLGSDEGLFAPVVGVVVLLRSLSPSLTFLKVQERFEARRTWPLARLAMLLLFPSMAGYLAYRLVAPAPGDALLLSERLAMAAGSALLLIRFYLLVVPKASQERLLLWSSAVAFSIALGVVAPYAFPGFEFYYTLSGIVGWSLGFLLVLRVV